MAGQGLDPVTGLPKQAMQDPYRDTARMVNPWIDPRGQEQGKVKTFDMR
jgi:hypothetical protein